MAERIDRQEAITQSGDHSHWEVSHEPAPLHRAGLRDVKDFGIYATDRQDTSTTLGYHNVRGVLNAATDDEAREKSTIYGSRNGDFPLDVRLNGGSAEVPTPQTGVFVPEATQPIQDQFAYLSALRGGDPIELWTPQDVRAANGGVLIAPYINDPRTERYITNELGAEAFGLPSSMVEVLKNKATFREIIDKSNMDTLRVPDYTTTTLENVQSAATSMLNFQETLYKDLDMKDYPRGVVIQSVNSDGGFGSVMVKQSTDKNGKDVIAVVKDGELATEIPGLERSNWVAAFGEAQEYLGNVIDGEKEDGVIVSRFVEIDDSPGGSVVVINGEVVGLGWNGQLINEGSNACVGTGTYVPKTKHARSIQENYEEQSVVDTQTILKQAARISGVDLSRVNGIGGVDYMLPSAREQELQEKRNKSKKWNGPKPSVYAVECNARGTNWTDAVKLLMYMYGDKQTVHNMKKRIAEGIKTYDTLPLLPGVTGAEVREEALARYADYRITKEGLTIVRMVPPVVKGVLPSLGVILHQDPAEKRKEIDGMMHTIYERKSS